MVATRELQFCIVGRNAMCPAYWTIRMRIARHMYVAYVQDVTGLSYILDMVATRELQFYIGRNVMRRLYWTTRMRIARNK